MNPQLLVDAFQGYRKGRHQPAKETPIACYLLIQRTPPGSLLSLHDGTDRSP